MQAINRGSKRMRFNPQPPKADSEAADASAGGAAGSSGYGSMASAPEFSDNPHLARPASLVYLCDHTATRVL